jgi:hypothetical protein
MKENYTKTILLPITASNGLITEAARRLYDLGAVRVVRMQGYSDLQFRIVGYFS